MAKWTLLQIRTKVENDLDLQEENFIQPAEFTGYVNEAISVAESEIHTIYEDYFLANSALALVQGQAAYSLPTDIYANKIRGIEYNNGSLEFPINRIHDWNKFRRFTLLNLYPAGNPRYNYIITNTAAAGTQINLAPTAQETSSNNVMIWYLRRAARVNLDTDTCDIPEDFIGFVLQYVKVRCYEKEGHPNLQMAMQAMDYERSRMIETLNQMVPDGDNEIDQDFSFYDDMS